MPDQLWTVSEGESGRKVFDFTSTPDDKFIVFCMDNANNRIFAETAVVNISGIIYVALARRDTAANVPIAIGSAKPKAIIYNFDGACGQTWMWSAPEHFADQVTPAEEGTILRADCRWQKWPEEGNIPETWEFVARNSGQKPLVLRKEDGLGYPDSSEIATYQRWTLDPLSIAQFPYKEGEVPE